jgi:hypothetical protein
MEAPTHSLDIMTIRKKALITDAIMLLTIV